MNYTLCIISAAVPPNASDNRLLGRLNKAKSNIAKPYSAAKKLVNSVRSVVLARLDLGYSDEPGYLSRVLAP
jgi:hypothetical protein